MPNNVLTLRSLRIAVLQGGDSTEREISLRSGAAVARGLESRGHRVSLVDPSRQDLSSIDWPKFDLAFLALHGRFGEDGQIQSLFDSWGVAYTGSDAVTSRLAFSKSATKERLTACGVATPPYVLIHESDSIETLGRVADQIGYPVVIKPDASGSSLGVSIVKSPEELPSAAVACFQEGAFGLIERAIVGSEWTLGLIDDDPLPLIRIDAQRAFYDFTAKYDDKSTGYHLDSDLSNAERHRIEAAGVATAVAVGTTGIARVDMRVDANGQPWVLEVNTIPGFTEQSLVPKAAQHRGLSFSDLCQRAVGSALAVRKRGRHRPPNPTAPPKRERLRHAG